MAAVTTTSLAHVRSVSRLKAEAGICSLWTVLAPAMQKIAEKAQSFARFKAIVVRRHGRVAGIGDLAPDRRPGPEGKLLSEAALRNKLAARAGMARSRQSRGELRLSTSRLLNRP